MFGTVSIKPIGLASLMLTGLLLLLSTMGTTAVEAASFKSPELIRTQLLKHYQRWEGVPYRYGGNGYDGVDCSGFVHIMFDRALGKEVPRSTKLLSRIRNKVSMRNLRAGDIIIFRTSYSGLHAGIYVGNGEFIHASKSKGVMRSRLSNPYWQDAYSKAVRVI